MSVKLVFNESSIGDAEENSGFCYCRRNSSAIPKGRTERKSIIELKGEEPIQTSIDFGRVPVESSQYHEVIIVSSSGSVPTEISEDCNSYLEPVDTAFRLTTSAFLPSCVGDRNQKKNTRLSFRIYFEPELPGMHYAQTLDLNMGRSAGIPIQINCRGDSFGPALCFSENQVNFGGQFYRDDTKRCVKLFNLSACEARFQFDVDNTRSAFKICPTAGVVPPHTTLKVEITFQAPKPQTYYKRILCFILHQQPQHLDLFGVCIPRPFMSQRTGIDFGLSSFQTQFLPLPSTSNQEYFDNNHCWGIHLSSPQLDFGYRELDLDPPPSPEPLSFSSSLPYDVVIEWTADPSGIFLVTPQSAILPSHRSTLFQVTFCPTFPNNFYSGQLECFAHPTEYNWPTYLGPPWAIMQEIGKMGFIDDSRDSKEEVNVESAPPPPPPTALPQVSDENLLESADPSDPKSSLKGKSKKRKSNVSVKKKSRSQLEKSIEIESVEEELGETDMTTPPEEETIGNGSSEDKPEEEQDAGHFQLSVTLSHLTDEPRNFCLLPIFPPEIVAVELNPVEGAELEEEEGKTARLERQLENGGWQSCEMPPQLGLPLCLTVSVLGHTCSKSQVVTKFKFPKRITMETTWPMNPTCRTICLKNGSDFPIHFDASSIEEHGIFRLKPNKGVVPGNFHQLILLSMMPTSPQPLVYVQNGNILLNLTEKNKISLCGVAETPRIEIIRQYDDFSAEPNEGLIFPMTVPNFSSEILIQLANPTRFSCRFHFSTDEVPVQTAEEEFFDPIKIFDAIPSHGIIEPYEFAQIKWTFSPKDLIRYTHIWKCVFNIQRGNVIPKEQLPHFEWIFPLSGIGESCHVEAFPTSLDFGLVELYTRETKTFTVTNTGNAVATLHFKAIHEQWLENFPPEQLTIEPKMASIGGQESIEVSVTIRSNLMTLERFYITYTIGTEVFQPTSDHQRLCSLRILGDHPILKVIDINHSALHPICDGSFSWSMFSLDKLNKFLGSPSTTVVQEGKIRTPPNVAFNFPPAPIGSEAAIFTLLLSNKSGLGTSWDLYGEPPKQLPQFLLDDETSTPFDGNHPTDPNFLGSLWSRRIIDKYQKAADGVDVDFSREKNICFSVKPFRDVNSFKVLPSSGRLEPKEVVQISFRYVYKSVGVHDMYLLLRVNPSIFIWIHLRGRTIENNVPFLQPFYDKELKLNPVALTDMDPPIQLIWMYNGGNVPAKFVVSPEPFKASKKENYGHDVFDLVDRRGSIPPLSWGSIKIRFCPIELREYSLPIVARWDGGEVHFKLLGAPLLRQGTLTSPAELGVLLPERYSLLEDPIIPFSITPSHVTFKHFIPTGQQDTTIVFLTNLSGNHEISFSWPEITAIDGGGEITFRPPYGILAPNGNATCQIVIRGGNASIMSTSLIRCSLKDETEATISAKQNKKWDTCKTFLLANRISEAEAHARLLKKYGQQPDVYKPCSKVISVTAYISSTFGMLDYNKTGEQLMRTPIPPCKPLSRKTASDIQSHPVLTLPPFAQQLSREVLRSVLWDIIHSDGFESFVKLKGGWKAPLFWEYEASEASKGNHIPKDQRKAEYHMEKGGAGDQDLRTQVSGFGSHDILKEVVFNLLTELDAGFKPNDLHAIELPHIPSHKLLDLERVF